MPKTIKEKVPKNKIDIKKTRFLVTGGSGSFGRSIIKKLLSLGAQNIVSISRNEDLIRQAQREVNSPFVNFKLGDITDRAMIENLMKDIDVVFHAAAIKHVSLAEKNPRETYRVNVLGLINLLDSSSSLKRFVHISSDKAIGVMNCYGATKLLGEYLAKESNDIYNNNTYLIIRCPNLLGSRGSVTDVWMDQLRKNNKITITDPEMTRYFVSLPDAGDFVVNLGLSDSDVKKIHYPLKYTKKYKIKDLAEAFLKVNGNKNSKIKIIGAFPGEKQHEDSIGDLPLTPVSGLIPILK